MGVEGNSEHTGYNVLATSKYALGDTLHTLRYGGEGYEQVSTRIDSSVQTNEDTADSHAFYLEDEVQLTQKLSVTPGIRYNYYSTEMESEGANDSLDKTWTEFTFGLEGKYRLTDAWTLNASATELFQGPGFRESYVDYATEFDQALKAETGINKTVGIAYLQNEVMGLDRLALTFLKHV
jgi:hemoglobin/transferrin/lactoferrin receptor protein